jgi:hypothetical protein
LEGKSPFISSDPSKVNEQILTCTFECKKLSKKKREEGSAEAKDLIEKLLVVKVSEANNSLKIDWDTSRLRRLRSTDSSKEWRGMQRV